MKQRALVVITSTLERRQQEHVDVGHGMLQVKHKLERSANADKVQM
jgi:hypothetical protein